MHMRDKAKLIQGIRVAYLDSLLSGNSREADLVIDQALARGLDPTSLYLQVILPAQTELGNLWHEGKVSVSEEHRGTQITLSLLGRLRSHLMERAKPRNEKLAVLTSIEGDPHLLGPRVVADFLQVDGWDVHFLGASTPLEELVTFVEKNKPHLVGLSLSLNEYIPMAARTVKTLKALKDPPYIMIGGSAFLGNEQLAKKTGADAFAANALDAVSKARKFTRGSDAAELQLVLKELGKRILESRKKLNLNQQELADSAGLDRTYISAVEHGKQNLTLGAILKIANALDVELKDIIVS